MDNLYCADRFVIFHILIYKSACSFFNKVCGLYYTSLLMIFKVHIVDDFVRLLTINLLQ